MVCPLCRKRATKRACPALHQDICPVCCATKRIVEVACPDDCAYLEASQRHPAAKVRKQMDRDITVLMTSVGRLSEPQAQLLFLLLTVVLNHQPEGLGRLADTDVAAATGALAQSLETSSRGIVYEETPSSPVAEGLRRELKALTDEMTRSGGSRAEREVAAVLRGIERGARHDSPGISGDTPGADDYLALAARVLQHRPKAQAAEAPRIITP